MKFHADKTGESPLCRMRGVETRQHCILRVNVRTGIFIGDFAKNMAFNEDNSGTTMSQMELLRAKGTRFCGILQSSVIPRLKHDDQYCCYS